MGGRAQHRNTNCCQPSGRYLAVSRVLPGGQDDTGRKPSAFLQAALTTRRTWSHHGRARIQYRAKRS